MKKLLFLLLACLCFPASAWAGIGFYVTIQNRTTYPAAITYGGNDKWHCNDFCGPQTVPAHATKRFYTEGKGAVTGGGIQGINLSYGSITARAEFWFGHHDYSVSHNIKLRESSVGVGTTSDKVKTDLNFYPMEGTYGTAYVTLHLN